jgi:hypothetical protein
MSTLSEQLADIGTKQTYNNQKQPNFNDNDINYASTGDQ